MLKIVGNNIGELFLEYNGKVVAKIIDEYFWKDFIDNVNDYMIKVNQPLTKNQRQKLIDHITDNVYDCIDTYNLKNIVQNAVLDSLEDYINDDSDDSDDFDDE